MENRKHLFKKGQSGNPNGRPKGTFSLTEMIRNKLQECPPEYKDKKTYAEILITTMLHKGIIEKDHASQKLIMNYVDGMPKQSIDLDAKGNFEFVIKKPDETN
jgi:hypothetical protein